METPATRFEQRVIPGTLTKKQRAQRVQQETQRMTQLQQNFQPSGPVGLGQLFQPARSPFGNKAGLALRGIAMLNSVKNVSCEPL